MYSKPKDDNDKNTDREANTAIDRPKNYRAKLANASFGRQGRAFQVSEKIILTVPAPVFSPKTLPYRKRSP